jgi:hypothetical protein
MAEVTFRDFAGAIMGGDAARAATVLQELLALPPDQATAATSHFRGRMSDPSSRRSKRTRPRFCPAAPPAAWVNTNATPLRPRPNKSPSRRSSRVQPRGTKALSPRATFGNR